MSLRAALADERLPLAFVDLDALDRNVDRIAATIAGSGKTLRVASKSVRHLGLLRRIMARGEGFAGLMCFTAEEAGLLAGGGFDDLLVAYPTLQTGALRGLAQAARKHQVWQVVDSVEHLQALGAAGRGAGVQLAAVLELDLALRPGPLHLGARRSPIRDARDALALAREAREIEGVRLAGLMGYEAHVAGLQDKTPFAPAMNPIKRAMKKVAVPALRKLRAQVVEALRSEGFALELVNGGGTGSLRTTSAEACVTEVTAGSGFLCPHLFDYFEDSLELEPAAFFALEACRASDPGYVTCLGGGYVASGEPGWDRLPIPWRPEGLRYVTMEGAGEVQTPLRLGGAQVQVGEVVIFRHAKAGELAERFNDYLLLRGGEPVGREPTYRGQGWCLL